MDGTMQMTVRTHGMAHLSNTNCKLYKHIIITTIKFGNQASASPRFPMEQGAPTLRHLT